MQNYFNYFTEIEEHYQRRRGSILLLSTLDWALIETWKDSGIPLAAVLRGIDSAFDSYDKKPVRAKTRKVNSLAYCSQEVLAAAEEMKAANVGAERKVEDPGMQVAEVAVYLRQNAEQLQAAKVSSALEKLVVETAATLQSLADSMESGGQKLEDIERHLTVLEEKIFAALLSSTPDQELISVRAEADRDIAPYRSKMGAAQIQQLHRQYVNKRLLQRSNLPRLSLFYM
ncbi:MAG TPA: hypothetical protein VMZ25_07535 [Terriglobales bacterium]|nr:hypothetical protein [Terriglobales bacterium]